MVCRTVLSFLRKILKIKQTIFLVFYIFRHINTLCNLRLPNSLPIFLLQAKALLRHLLVRDPANRLGSGEGDASEVKQHPFFKSIDWDALGKGHCTPPWAPPVAGSMDVSQFDSEFTNMLPIGMICLSG